MLAIRDSKRLKAIIVKVPGNWVPCLFVDLVRDAAFVDANKLSCTGGLRQTIGHCTRDESYGRLTCCRSCARAIALPSALAIGSTPTQFSPNRLSPEFPHGRKRRGERRQILRKFGFDSGNPASPKCPCPAKPPEMRPNSNSLQGSVQQRWVVVCAVPTSPSQELDSLFCGKIQGIRAKSGLSRSFLLAQVINFADVFDANPYCSEQGKIFAERGSFSDQQGSSNGQQGT